MSENVLKFTGNTNLIVAKRSQELSIEILEFIKQKDLPIEVVGGALSVLTVKMAKKQKFERMSFLGMLMTLWEFDYE